MGAQWLAWRIKVPSILLLLVVGFLAGPVTGFLSPEALQGEWLFAFVSLAIGVILFEGGLSLRVADLREIGRSVVSLITIGVVVTWVLAGLAAHYILGFEPALAIQIGAILTVTGPTVVIPILRHVRPAGKIATIARWEGITIDPVGAIISVLVLEALLLINGAAAETLNDALLDALMGMFKEVFVSIGLSITGGALLMVILRRRLVPDYLLNSTALAIVLVVFELSNLLQQESGLLTVTLMGIMLANQKMVSVRRITEFKEDLQVLLIACLFILLSARLELSALDYIKWPAWIFLGVLIFVVRPVSVFLSLRGTALNWREQTFLAWLAPRGIVAAAVATLFSIRLEPFYGEQVNALVPIIFLVIVGTVVVYGLTLSPLARYLGLAQPDPQGVLLLGAYGVGLEIAAKLKEIGFKVLVIDANAGNIEMAQKRGITAMRANALSETVVDDLDLGGIGSFLALTPNDEVNSLAALHFAEVFESKNIYQVMMRAEPGREHKSDLPLHLRGRPLFGAEADFLTLSQRFDKGATIKTIKITKDVSYENLVERYEGDLLVLFVKQGNKLNVVEKGEELQIEEGDTVVVMTPPSRLSRQMPDEKELFEQMIHRSFVLDLKEAVSFKEIVLQASALLAQRLPIPADQLARGFLEGARYGASLLTQSVALPHLRLPDIEQSELLLVRCRNGVSLQFEDLHYEGSGTMSEQEPQANSVAALLFLVSPEQKPRLHLRMLSEIVQHIDREDFNIRWRTAKDESDLREVLLPKNVVPAEK